MFQKDALCKALRNHIEQDKVTVITVYDSEMKYTHEVKYSKQTGKPVITNDLLIDIYGDEWANITTDKGLSISIIHEYGYSEIHDHVENEVSTNFANQLEG